MAASYMICLGNGAISISDSQRTKLPIHEIDNCIHFSNICIPKPDKFDGYEHSCSIENKGNSKKSSQTLQPGNSSTNAYSWTHPRTTRQHSSENSVEYLVTIRLIFSILAEPDKGTVLRKKIIIFFLPKMCHLWAWSQETIWNKQSDFWKRMWKKYQRLSLKRNQKIEKDTNKFRIQFSECKCECWPFFIVWAIELANTAYDIYFGPNLIR